jgi:hypothetical protein
VIENVLILVEAKAGAVAGRPRPALRDVVGAAVAQSERARIAITAGSPLYDAGNQPIEIDLSSIETVISIELTLADTAWASASTWSLRELGVVAPEATAIWPVSLFDLELVCELAEVPAQLVHYLLVRQRVDAARISFSDELDVFMAYWDNELDKLATPATGMRVVASWTSRLDDYLLERELAEMDGAPFTRDPPRQQIAKKTMKLLRKLEALRDPGFLDESLKLLDTAVREPVPPG